LQLFEKLSFFSINGIEFNIALSNLSDEFLNVLLNILDSAMDEFALEATDIIVLILKEEEVD